MVHLSLITTILLIAAYLWVRRANATEGNYQVWSQDFSVEILNRVLSFVFAQLLLWYFPAKSLIAKGLFVAVGVVVALDFLFYWRHRFYHRFGMAFHSMHHQRPGFDMLLALRIHPTETLVQVVCFFAVVRLVGLSDLEATLVNLVFTVQAFYSHLEIEIIPARLKHQLGQVFVLPTFHEHHHDKSGGHNYGFLLSVWDRIFKTCFKEDQCHK